MARDARLCDLDQCPGRQLRCSTRQLADLLHAPGLELVPVRRPVILKPCLERIGVLEPRRDVGERQAPLTHARVVFPAQDRVLAMDAAAPVAIQLRAARLDVQEPALGLLEVDLERLVMEHPDPLVVLPGRAGCVDLDAHRLAAACAAGAQVGVLLRTELECVAQVVVGAHEQTAILWRHRVSGGSVERRTLLRCHQARPRAPSSVPSSTSRQFS